MDLKEIIRQAERGFAGTVALLPLVLIIAAILIFTVPMIFVWLVILSFPVLLVICILGFAEELMKKR